MSLNVVVVGHRRQTCLPILTIRFSPISRSGNRDYCRSCPVSANFYHLIISQLYQHLEHLRLSTCRRREKVIEAFKKHTEIRLSTVRQTDRQTGSIRSQFPQNARNSINSHTHTQQLVIRRNGTEICILLDATGQLKYVTGGRLIINIYCRRRVHCCCSLILVNWIFRFAHRIERKFAFCSTVQQ